MVMFTDKQGLGLGQQCIFLGRHTVQRKTMGIFTFQVFAFENSVVMNIQILISVYPFQVFL